MAYPIVQFSCCSSNFIYLSIYPSIRLSVYPSISLSIYGGNGGKSSLVWAESVACTLYIHLFCFVTFLASFSVEITFWLHIFYDIFTTIELS